MINGGARGLFFGQALKSSNRFNRLTESCPAAAGTSSARVCLGEGGQGTVHEHDRQPSGVATYPTQPATFGDSVEESVDSTEAPVETPVSSIPS